MPRGSTGDKPGRVVSLCCGSSPGCLRLPGKFPCSPSQAASRGTTAMPSAVWQVSLFTSADRRPLSSLCIWCHLLPSSSASQGGCVFRFEISRGKIWLVQCAAVPGKVPRLCDSSNQGHCTSLGTLTVTSGRVMGRLSVRHCLWPFCPQVAVTGRRSGFPRRRSSARGSAAVRSSLSLASRRNEKRWSVSWQSL